MIYVLRTYITVDQDTMSLFSKDLTLELGKLDQAIISDYQLWVIFFNLKLKASSFIEDTFMEDYKNAVDPLFNSGVLSRSKALRKNNVYDILGKKLDSPGEAICSVDPFAYISHMSAMEYYGLTDRVPRITFYSTPPAKEWKIYSTKKMDGDCKGRSIDYLDTGAPPLVKLEFKKVMGVTVNQHSSIHLGSFKKIQGKSLRVATIGKTFIDMLKEPTLCGGMSHVVNVFSEHAKHYSKLIQQEIDKNGNKIDKVRAGYILEEQCGIQSDVISSWVIYAQRGGSRKLDPSAEYSSNYSEKWSLSLNI